MKMDLLNGKVKNIYFKYLATVFAGSCIPCIYGIVDMVVVGQYYGPDGTAAMTVVMPVFNIIYSLGLLVGIGGSVLFSTQRGKDPNDARSRNEFFTVSLVGAIFFSLLVWAVCFPFGEQLLTFFGADEELMPLSLEYMLPIKIMAPAFLFTQFFSAFLRNDNSPGLVTAAVLAGGIFNVVADVVFVFGLDMGIMGAGLASGLGAIINNCVLISHFFSKKNTIKVVKVTKFFKKAGSMLVTGFSTFITDFALGIITVLFNRQIMKYFGTTALSIFGMLMNINTFVQCCGYTTGQAAQPLFSVSYGANKYDRIKETLRYGLITSIIFGVIWLVLVMSIPNAFVRLFMSPTEEVLAMAPSIVRKYGLAFLILPFNVFSTYYFQSIMKPKVAMTVSLSRGLVLCSIFVLVLPLIFGADALWFAMPLTEVFTAVFAAIMMAHYTKKLKA